MASYTASSTTYHGTLSGSTVDTVVFPTGIGNVVSVGNDSGNDPIFVVVGNTSPADPTAYGAGTVTIPAGKTFVLGQPSRTSSSDSLTFKIIGNGNAYAIYLGEVGPPESPTTGTSATGPTTVLDIMLPWNTAMVPVASDFVPKPIGRADFGFSFGSNLFVHRSIHADVAYNSNNGGYGWTRPAGEAGILEVSLQTGISAGAGSPTGSNYIAIGIEDANYGDSSYFYTEHNSVEYYESTYMRARIPAVWAGGDEILFDAVIKGNTTTAKLQFASMLVTWTPL